MDVFLSEEEIKHIRWSLHIATNVLAEQEQINNPDVDKKKAVSVIAQLDIIDEKLYDCISPTEDEDLDREQLSLF